MGAISISTVGAIPLFTVGAIFFITVGAISRSRIRAVSHLLLAAFNLTAAFHLAAALLFAPTPASARMADPDDFDWWSPGEGRIFPRVIDYANELGRGRVVNVDGPTDTAGHPFFEPLGGNGRACVTCHQPADAMSVSVSSIRERWRRVGLTDPLFAAVDGSNCPNLDQEEASSHSLLLEHGLFRIFRPWPPRTPEGDIVEPEFEVEVVRDPTGCNTDPVHGIEGQAGNVSVYRRPRQAANLKYLTAVGFPFDPKAGMPLARDPQQGNLISGNLLADARVGTLEDQALDALRSHMEVHGDPGSGAIRRILEFEQGLYAAQVADETGGSLTALGARGGPEALADAKPGVLNTGSSRPMWQEFDPWLEMAPAGPDDDPEARAFRESVARGVKLFRERTFLVSDNAGITSMGFGNPVRNDCNFCHNMTQVGIDVAPGQVDLGTTNEPFMEPAPHLPLFKLTCKPGERPHPHLGRVVYSSDPGLALTTGKCADIGRITIQPMRGLAARAPYFSNGSASTLREVVDYYDRRYDIGLSEQEKEDLTNLMRAL